MHAPGQEAIAALVHAVRGERVLLDADLATLYGVSTKALNQAVSRNRARFPGDFMFQLSAQEYAAIRSQFATGSAASRNWSQFVTSSRKHRGLAYRPYAFTEQGVAMLSSVLRSSRAVEVNKIEAMEKKYDEQFGVVFDAIKRLIAEDDARRASPKRRIGFIG